MLLGLWMLGDAEAPPPVLGAVNVVNLANGGCPGPTPDTIRVTWTVTGPNDFYYETRVYRNDVLVTPLPNSTVQLDVLAPGSINADGGPQGLNWTFRVDVVRKSSGEVVATQAAAPFVTTVLTTCGPS